MKLNNILSGELDLSEAKNLQLIRHLSKGSKVRFFGKECIVESALHRDNSGKWRIIVEFSKTGEKYGFYISEHKKQVKMTDKEKRVMKENIQGNLVNHANNQERLVSMCRVYYKILVEFNNYRIKDVEEVMQTFGESILHKADIIFEAQAI